MEHKLSQLKKLKNIKLSQEERAYLRTQISVAMSAPHPVTEPIFSRGVHHGLPAADRGDRRSHRAHV